MAAGYNTEPMVAYGYKHGLDAFMARWWALAENYRYLRIKGGIYVVNAGKIG